MHIDPRQFVKALTATALVTIFAVPQSLVAQSTEHVVSPTELQKAVVDASQKKQQNLDTLNQFLSSEKAQRALAQARSAEVSARTEILDKLAELAYQTGDVLRIVSSRGRP